MRDALNVIGLNIVYKDQKSKIHSINFVPTSGGIYVTLEQKENILINVPYKEIYKLIRQQINKL